MKLWLHWPQPACWAHVYHDDGEVSVQEPAKASEVTLMWFVCCEQRRQEVMSNLLPHYACTSAAKVMHAQHMRCQTQLERPDIRMRSYMGGAACKPRTRGLEQSAA